MIWRLALVVCTLVHFEANAQICDAGTEQPTVTLLTPPSGTTGIGSSLSSVYFLQGERFDSISRMEIQFPPPQSRPRASQIIGTGDILQRNSTTISFQIPQISNIDRTPGGIPAFLVIYPSNTACQNITLSMSLHETGIPVVIK